MPVTGLKIVGRGHVYHLLFFFFYILKMSGYRRYAFLEFWCWNLVPFMPDIYFQLLKSLWSSLTYFSFNDASNVIWTAGRPIQHSDSSTTKLCSSNSCSVVLHCPAEIHKALPEIYIIWRGAHAALKPLYTFQQS